MFIFGYVDPCLRAYAKNSRKIPSPNFRDQYFAADKALGTPCAYITPNSRVFEAIRVATSTYVGQAWFRSKRKFSDLLMTLALL